MTVSAPPVDEDLARALLAFEDEHGHARDKEERIRRDLHLTPARYWQLLNRLIDTELALRIDPMLTRRLLRRRAQARADHARFTTPSTI